MANFYPRYNQPQFSYGYSNVMNQNSMYNNNDYSNRNYFNVDNRFPQSNFNSSNSYYPYPLSQSKPIVISDYKKQQQMEYKAYLDMQVANHRNSKINQSTPIVSVNSTNSMSEMDREMIRKLNEKKRKEEYNRILQQQIEEKKKRKELERQKQIEYDMKFEEQLKRYEQEMNEKKKMQNNTNSVINKPIRPYSNNIVSKINLNLNNEPNPPKVNNNLKVLNRTKTQYDSCNDNMKFSFGAQYANMQTAIENNTPRINNNRVSNTKYNFFSNNEFDPNTIDSNTVYNRTKSNFADTNDMLNKLIEANFDRIKYDNEHNIKFEAKDSMKRMTFGDNSKAPVENIQKAKESTIQRIVNDIDFNALEYRSKYENLDGTLKNDDDKMMQSMKSSSKLITPNQVEPPMSTAYKSNINDTKKSSISTTAENIMRSSRTSFNNNNIKPITKTNNDKDYYKMKTSFSDYDKLRAKELGKNGDKIYDEIKDILSSKEKDIEIENKTKSILSNVKDEDSEDEVDKIVKKYANTKTSEIVSETLRSTAKKKDDTSIYKLIQKHNIEDRSAFKDPVFAPSIVDNKSSGIFKLTSNDDKKETMKDNLEFKESKEQNFNIIQRKMIKEKVDNFQLESQRKEPEKKEELPSLLDSFSDILLDKEEIKESFKLNKKTEENIDEDNLCNIRYKDEEENKEDTQSNKEPSHKEEDDEEALITISNSSDEKQNKNTTDDFEDKMNFFGDSKYSNFNIAKSKKDKITSSKDKNRHMNLFNSIKESSPSEMMEDSYCDKIIENIDKYRQMAHTDNDDKQI